MGIPISNTVSSSQPRLRDALPDRVPAPTVQSNAAIEQTAIAATKAAAQPDHAELSKAMEAVQKQIATVANNLQFSVDGDTGQTVVRVVDVITKEVIRQIPSEEFLALSKNLEKLQGLFLKAQA